jgi:ribonuclease BN (tRNA processing enzyme)
VPHSVPTLAYRLQAQNKAIVFGADQDGSDPRFIDFARGADVLVMHLALGAGARSGGGLHASPSDVGRVAREAQVGRLVLSHFGLSPLEPAIAELRKYYVGPITVGEDLQCTAV